MKKSIIATAVAAGMLATGAAQASPSVYGIIHLSIDSFSDNHYAGGSLVKPDEPEMKSNTSAIGVKGSEDLGNGLKALYKLEWQVDVANRNSGGALTDRDQWVGLKGGWGKVVAGTMSSNYKQMGGKIDPFYRTVAEGRGILNMQSAAHGGAGTDGQGRMSQALQYTTPKMAGIEIVLNTTVSAAGGGNCVTPTTPGGVGCDETIGIGARWSNKNWLAYIDYLDPNAGGTGPANAATPPTTFLDESIVKIGGKWSNKAFMVGAQYEATEDQTGGDYLFLSGMWNINKANAVALTFGQQDNISQSYAIGYVHSMSKQTNVYAAYGFVEADTCTGTSVARTCSYSGIGTFDAAGNVDADEGQVISLGIRKSF